MGIKMLPTHSMEGIEAAHVMKAERLQVGVVVLSRAPHALKVPSGWTDICSTESKRLVWTRSAEVP